MAAAVAVECYHNISTSVMESRTHGVMVTHVLPASGEEVFRPSCLYDEHLSAVLSEFCLSRISILGIFAHYVILIDFLQKLTFTFDCLLQFLLFFVSLCRPLFVAVADQKTLQSTFATYELWS